MATNYIHIPENEASQSWTYVPSTSKSSSSSSSGSKSSSLSSSSSSGSKSSSSSGGSSSGTKSPSSSGSGYAGMTQAQLQNQQNYLNDLIQNGSTGNQAWAKSQMNELQKYLGSSSSGGSSGGSIYSGMNQAQLQNQQNYLNNLVQNGSTGNANWAKGQLNELQKYLGSSSSGGSGSSVSGGTQTSNGTSITSLSKVLADNGFSNDIYGKAEYVSRILNGVGTKDPTTGKIVTQDDAVKYLESLGLKVSGSTEGGSALVVSDGDRFNQWYLMSGSGYTRGGMNGSSVQLGNGDTVYTQTPVLYGNIATGTGGTQNGVNSDYENQKQYLTNLINNGTRGQAAWAKAQLEQLVAGNNTTANRTGATSNDLWLENQRTYLNNLIQNGTQGQAAWAKNQLQNLQNSSGGLAAGSSGTNYNGMTQAQLDNQRAYLNNLINSGTTGQATWAHKELQNLNLASASNPNNASLGKDGYWYYNRNNGGAPVRNDYSQLIKDTYNTQADLYKQANNLAVESAVQKLRDTYQNGLAKYQSMRDQTAIDTAKSLDTQALMSQLNGDYGGLGNKQYGVLQAAGANQLLQINLEQQNLLNTTEQQVAQLVMEGKIEEAKMLAELAQSQMDALINEGDKVYQSYFNAYNTDKDVQFKEAELLGKYKGQDTVASKQQNFQNALTRLQMGIFSESDAKALGIPADQAKQYADYINTLAQLDLQAAKADLANATSSGGRGGRGGGRVSTSGGGGGGDGLIEVEDPNAGVPTPTTRPPFTGSTYSEAIAYLKQYGETEQERNADILDQATFVRKKNAASTTPFNIPGTNTPITAFKTYQDYLKYMTGSY